MKVVHIFTSLGYGGIETMLVNIANEQNKLGASVAIIIINDLVAEELISRLSPEINVVQLNRSIGSKSLLFVKQLNCSLTELNPDVIHLHNSSLYDLLSKKWRNSISCSVCSTLHAMPTGVVGVACRWGRFFQNFVLHQGGNVMNSNRVKKVFSISKSVANALSMQYGISSEVIYNGIQTKLFFQRQRVSAGNEFKIVQVSRLVHEKKGQDLLIDAVRILKDRNINISVTFIGDGESRLMLENMAENYGIQDNIKFLGTQSQDYITKHLCKYDLFVQPSRYEGFGLTVAEAMAACVPVLVSSGQGPSEVTEGAKYGWVFENGNTESLVNEIEYIINHYETCLEKSEIAKKHVEEKYDVSVTASKYLKAYSYL